LIFLFRNLKIKQNHYEPIVLLEISDDFIRNSTQFRFSGGSFDFNRYVSNDDIRSRVASRFFDIEFWKGFF